MLSRWAGLPPLQLEKVKQRNNGKHAVPVEVFFFFQMSSSRTRANTGCRGRRKGNSREGLQKDELGE